MRPWIIDADDIDVSSEANDMLVEQTPAIKQFLSRSATQFIVTGTKGYGKTLLLKAKRLSLQNEMVCVPANSLLDKPIGDKVFNRQMIEMLSGSTQPWRRIWRVAICVAVLKRLESGADAGAFRTLGSLLGNGNLVSAIDHFVNILDFTPRELVEAANEADGALIPRLRNIGTPIAVFIDSVDEYFNKHIGDSDASSSATGELSPDVWYLSQMGLLEAAYELRRVTHHLKVFATIRKEAYARLAANNYMAQQYAGSVVDLTYSYEDLRDMFLDNIRAEPRANLVKGTALSQDPVEAFVGRVRLHNSYTGEEEDVFDYIYRHTLQRPRDLMTIGACLSGLPTRQRENPELIKKAVNRAATEIANEYLAEIQPYFGDVTLPLLWGLVPGPIMTASELQDVAARYSALHTASGGAGPTGTQVLTLLYKMGLLGYTVEDVATAEVVQRFVAPGERTFDRDAILPPSSHHLVHPALTELIAARNPAYLQRIDRTNIVGSRRPWRAAWQSASEARYFVLRADVKGFSRFMVDPDTDAKIRTSLSAAVEQHAADAIYREVVQGDSITIVHADAESTVSAAQRIMEDLYRVEGRPSLRVAIVHGSVRLEETSGSMLLRGGAAIRLAARVEPKVEPNEIWVDEVVKRALDDAKAYYTGEEIHVEADSDGRMDVRKPGSDEPALRVRLFRIVKRH